jgi:hypothetical protein
MSLPTIVWSRTGTSGGAGLHDNHRTALLLQFFIILSFVYIVLILSLIIHQHVKHTTQQCHNEWL